MAEQTQVQQVMTKEPKKVEQGERLDEFSHKKKEELAQVAKAEESEPKPSQANSIGAVIAVGLLGYYTYQRSNLKGDNNAAKVNTVETQKRPDKFEME